MGSQGYESCWPKRKNTTLKDSHVLGVQTKATTHDGTTMAPEGPVECMVARPSQYPRLLGYYNGHDTMVGWRVDQGITILKGFVVY